MSSYSTPFLFIFLLFFSIITTSYSARILLDVADPPQSFQHPTQPSITFIMQDILPKTNIVNPQQQQQQQQQQQLPFAKPLRTFPLTYGGIPLPHQTNPNEQNSPTQTFDIPKFGIAFTTTSKDLQEEMEFGLVTNIEEEIYDENSMSGLTTTLVGKSRGVYVAMNSSTEDENDNHNSHMMAMTVTFSTDVNADDDDDDDDEVDRLKLFGVHRRDVMECHVAVIGGTGKFKDANGFAVIKVLSLSGNKGFSDAEESSEEANNMMLLYNVYLS